MSVEKKHIINRLYIVAILLLLLFLGVVYKVFQIQYIKGDQYRKLSEELTVKTDTIPASRGSVFSENGSLLATSMPQYEIRMDPYAVDKKVFQENVHKLAKKLAGMLGGSSQKWENKIRKARRDKNRYILIARGLDYKQYLQIKSFPIFKLGVYKGGFIDKQTTVRAHPLGKIAERTIGYDDHRGASGIEGAFREDLKGRSGWRLMQKLPKGRWKPINDGNEKEPVDGKDIITTINVNIQDIAHHSLLRQLEKYQADHGCAVVMETKTGEIKAITNLGRGKNGKYYERRNYAVWESAEPGSAFKVMAMATALDLAVVDTGAVVNTGKGRYRIHGRTITDSHHGGYGEISFARVLEVSSNIGFAKVIEENFGKNPSTFIDKLKQMHLDMKIGVPIKGEGTPVIPKPGDKLWSKNALPSIAYGYNLKMTPLQILTFYNAIANNGVMVKPRFIKEIRSGDKVFEKFDVEVIDSEVCSEETVKKLKVVLENVVKRGTGERLYSPTFSMAGKTGTARKEYWKPDWSENKKYISSFTGYFPADNPKYSCIVVIHEPKVGKGYYGADVAGPVLKDMAQKIYTSNYITSEVDSDNFDNTVIEESFGKYVKYGQKYETIMPNLVGIPAMDAISLLENMGLNVQCKGNGRIVGQSIESGVRVKPKNNIILRAI